MRESPPASGPPSSSGSPQSLAVEIDLDEAELRFPGLMDPEAVETLAAQGFKVFPAFRLRHRREVEFDLSLGRGQSFSWWGDLVAHSWLLASPPDLPRLRFGRDPSRPHRCRLHWRESSPLDLDPEERHHRYLELHHEGKGPRIPLAVIYKPEPSPAEGFAPEGPRPAAPSVGPEESPGATFRISFRRLDGRFRPWFDIFRQELFPSGVEPEPILQVRDTRGYGLELELQEGEFVAHRGVAPRIQWYDALGPLPKQPEHVRGVEIRGAGRRLLMQWSSPERETVTSFDVLCRHRGQEIWLDPTIYTKGIG